jgi:hypothetical protein
VDARTRLLAAVVAALLVGCGGGGGDDSETGTSRPSTVSGPPKAEEPLAAAARRLERALAQGKCKPLARLMLHSVRRGRDVDPATPPTEQECAFIRTEAGHELRGFKLTKVQQFGPTGVTEATGANARPGDVVGSLWALDVDGSWKLLYDATLRQQIGLQGSADFGTNARRLVRAVAARDCDTFWRLLNVGSRFVRTAEGHKARFCKSIAATYKQKAGGIGDLAADPGAKPKQLGTTRDIGFFGVELKSGRYLALAFTGRIGGIADTEQKQHEDPSALEIVSARLPAK